MDNPTPSIAILVPTRAHVVDSSFHAIMSCVLWTQRWWDRTYGPDAKFYYCAISRAHVDFARSQLARLVMDLKVDWILWLDDDAIPPHDLVARLIANDKDVIVPAFSLRIPKGLCPNKVYTHDDRVWEYVDPFPPRLHRIDLTGFHAVLMKRSVLERIAARPDIGKEYIFQNLARVGEDGLFWALCGEEKIEAWCDSSVVVGHVGMEILSPEEGVTARENAKNAEMLGVEQ